jgi:hypothetical protein
LAKTAPLENMRRKFGSVVFRELDFEMQLLDAPYFSAVKKLFERIGPNLLELSFEYVTTQNADFYGLLQKTSDLIDLNVFHCEIRRAMNFCPAQQLNFKCKNLKKLVVRNTKDLHHIASVIPDSLEYLTMQSFHSSCILNRQKRLETLHIVNCFVGDFSFAKENCNLEELYLIDVSLDNETDFQNLTAFVKSQKKLKKFRLDIENDFELAKYNYLEILVHVLSQKSLEDLEIRYIPAFKQLPAIQINDSNLSHLTLTIDPRSDASYFKNLAIMHPKIPDLKIEFDISTSNGFDTFSNDQFLLYADIRDICWFKNVVTLEVDHLNGELLGQIELKKMQKFVIEAYAEMQNDYYLEIHEGDEDFEPHLDESENWRMFTSKNPQLKSLKVHGDPSYLSPEIFEIVVNGLPLLKVLKFAIELTDENFDAGVALIQAKVPKLELELKLPWKLRASLPKRFPNARIKDRGDICVLIKI